MLRQVLGKPARLENTLLEAAWCSEWAGVRPVSVLQRKAFPFFPPLQCIRKMECLGSTQLLEVAQTLQRVAGHHSLPSWKSLSHSPRISGFQG